MRPLWGPAFTHAELQMADVHSCGYTRASMQSCMPISVCHVPVPCRYVQRELPLRLARRLLDLQLLPYIVVRPVLPYLPWLFRHETQLLCPFGSIDL